jgi:hypothetical protein
MDTFYSSKKTDPICIDRVFLFFHGLSFSTPPGVKWDRDQKQMKRSIITGEK